jgi:hypothetical protein
MNIQSGLNTGRGGNGWLGDKRSINCVMFMWKRKTWERVEEGTRSSNVRRERIEATFL